LVMREGHLTGELTRAEATQEKIILAATTALTATAGVAAAETEN
jgi:hypothetical protein